ncbi:MAG: beta-lactamase family protein [Verrucomicrobiales bacterium]|jgi:CubicO group peptidase (beta-lactamase class C family)|nr:beta-lactamase family protein [Verrucomicrobiales bacterium]
MSAFPKTISLIKQGLSAGLQIGAQLYVSRHGEVLANRAFGAAGNSSPMTADTWQLWMSAGKPLTATAIMQLWEQGKLQLDDPVVKFIPEFAVHDKEAITIRQILTHTAPLRQGDLVKPQADWDATISALCQIRKEPRWEPGQKAGYHTGGSWFILAEIVRRVSGLAISDYLREKIFLPLGMNHSQLGLTQSTIDANREHIALFYQTETPPSSPHPLWGNLEIIRQPRPGSNCLGPAHELGRFYEALLNGGRGVLKPETVALMTRRHREGMMDHTFRHVLDIGLGVILNSNRYGIETVPYGYGRHAGENSFGHNGSQSSAAFADPDNGLVVSVIFNGMCGEVKHQVRMRETLTAIYDDLGI